MHSFLNSEELFASPCLEQNRIEIFLLLDGAASNTSMLNTMYQHESNPCYVPLFLGTQHEKDMQIGPQLVQVSTDSPLLSWFIDNGADSGIILFADNMQKLADHLRPFLEAILPDDKHRMFRFYDPMIFYYFWPSLTSVEQRLFLGPAMGAACARPKCAPEGDSLLVSFEPAQNPYVAPTEKKPWFVSERSYAALCAPSEFSLKKRLTEEFCLRYPRTSRLTGMASVSRLAQVIVENNRSIGLIRPGNIFAYMAEVADLGVGYQQDPQFWRINQAVANANDPDAKLHALTSTAKEFRDLVWGRHGVAYYMALGRVVRINYDDLLAINNLSEVSGMLTALYPERAAYVGSQDLSSLTVQAQNLARELGFALRPGVVVCAGLLFFLGVDCINDPLHPWIASALKQTESNAQKIKLLFDVIQRMARLELRQRRISHEEQEGIRMRELIQPLQTFHLGHHPSPLPGSSLEEYLGILHPPLLERGDLQSALENSMSQQPELPLQIRALLTICFMLAELSVSEFDPPSREISQLCASGETLRAVYLLQGEIHILAQKAMQDLNTPKGHLS